MSTTQRKHAAMIDRLSNLHQARLSTKTNPKDPTSESTQSFLTTFTNSKQSIQSSLAQTANPDPNSDLEKISNSISDLGKLVAENSYFLPAYEVRSSLKTISDLKQTLDSVTSKLKPRKKFSSKNKPAKKPESEPEPEPEPEPESNSSYTINDSPGFRGTENAILTKDFSGLEIRAFVCVGITSN